MRDIYLNQIVDITDPKCEFINEFNKEIRKYGALVYNHASNCYQFIKRFEQMDYKIEVLPDLMRVENSDALLNALNLTIHYEFDPETEEDEENLAIWNEEISQIELPIFAYDEDGEVYDDKYVEMNVETTKHTVWFLNKESFDYIQNIDLLMITPIIKNINIARELIKKYAVHPFKFEYDEADIASWQEPELVGVYGSDYELQPFDEFEDEQCECGHHHHHDEHCDCGCHDDDCGCGCHDEDCDCDCDEDDCCCGHHHHHDEGCCHCHDDDEDEACICHDNECEDEEDDE